MTLALEALTVGGVIFVMAIARKTSSSMVHELSRFPILFSTLLAITQVLFVGATSAILMNSADLAWADVIGASYCAAGGVIIVGASLVVGFARARYAKFVWPAG